MLKQIELRYGGAAAQVGGQDLLRILPNRFVDCIGPFTFLDYFPEEFQRSGGILHGLQFWINLPAKNKAEEPAYKPFQSDEIPEYKLDKDMGKLRVLIGDYGEHKAGIPVYSRQFLYHIILNPGGVFFFDKEKDMEYAAQFISGEGKVNDADATEPELFVFSEKGRGIHLVNTGESQMDVILFGGDAYLEPIEAGGPFVMNTREELSQA